MLVYFALVLVIGVVAERRTRGDGDFMLGGRRTGPWVAAVGAAASSSSAWTLLGVSGAAYSWGLSALWLFPACVGGFCLNWFMMAPALRDFGHRRGGLSVPDILARRSSDSDPTDTDRFTRVYAAVLILASMGAYVAAQYQGAGKTFSVVFGISVELAVIIGALAVFLYTMLGGFVAVSLTDTLQGLVMATTALILPVLALAEVGGFAGLAQSLEKVTAEGYLSFSGPRSTILGVGFAAGLLGIGLGYPGQPHVVKYFLAMDERPSSVTRGRVIAIVWAAIVYGGMLILGLCGRAMFPELADKEVVLVKVTESLVHPVLAGVMLSAILSAIMSTADSQLLVASGAVTTDLRLGKGSGRELWVIRGTVAALSVGSVIAALLGTDEIFSAVLFGWAAMGAGFAPGLVIRVVLKRRLSARDTGLVMVTGSLLAIAGHLFYGDWLGPPELRNVFIHVVPVTTASLIGLARSQRSV